MMENLYVTVDHDEAQTLRAALQRGGLTATITTVTSRYGTPFWTIDISRHDYDAGVRIREDMFRRQGDDNG